MHPVTGIMAGAVAAALCLRWFAGRFGNTVVRQLEGWRYAPLPGPQAPPRDAAAPGARWRRLEAARSGLVIAGPDPKAGRPTSA